jgi:hypothetical protein
VLSHEETVLKNMLKKHTLVLASLKRTIARLRSRIGWIKKGDTNTKKFILTPATAKERISLPSWWLIQWSVQVMKIRQEQ